jgi:predicted nucleotidyltransferase
LKNFDNLNLKSKEKNAIYLFRKKVLNLYPKSELIIFGSKARGDFNKDSDIDILILVDEINNKVESDIHDIVYDIIYKFEIPINETIAEKKLLETAWSVQIPFYANVIKEGVKV